MSAGRNTDRSLWLTFSETLRALSISSFLVKESLGLHCRAPALVTSPVQLKPSSPTCFLMWEPIWTRTEELGLLFRKLFFSALSFSTVLLKKKKGSLSRHSYPTVSQRIFNKGRRDDHISVTTSKTLSSIKHQPNQCSCICT